MRRGVGVVCVCVWSPCLDDKGKKGGWGKVRDSIACPRCGRRGSGGFEGL